MAEGIKLDAKRMALIAKLLILSPAAVDAAEKLTPEDVPPLRMESPFLDKGILDRAESQRIYDMQELDKALAAELGKINTRWIQAREDVERKVGSGSKLDKEKLADELTDGRISDDPRVQEGNEKQDRIVTDIAALVIEVVDLQKEANKAGKNRLEMLISDSDYQARSERLLTQSRRFWVDWKDVPEEEMQKAFYRLRIIGLSSRVINRPEEHVQRPEERD